MGADSGLDEASRGRIALVATELGTNLVKHADGGEVLLRTVQHGGTKGLELLALDRGPGMQHLDQCLRDGYSTAGSPGTGLGAISRNSDQFEIHTLHPVGTIILVRFWAAPLPKPTAAVLHVGAVHLPQAGEEVCGDGWAIDQRGSRAVMIVTDGLGHGPLAADASRAAIQLFRNREYCGPEALMSDIHQGLRATRGAAVAVAEIDFDAERIRFVGVGNIAGTIFANGSSRSMVSHNGTAGLLAHKIQSFEYAFPRHALVVMHSDGLTAHWKLEQYPGLASRDPQLIAGILYRDFNRGRDDVTVVVVREGEPTA